MKLIPIEDLNFNVKEYDTLKKSGINYVHEIVASKVGAEVIFSMSESELDTLDEALRVCKIFCVNSQPLNYN
ncbi:hypothetical protein B5G50_21490 [Brevibacillus brevis]|nr:DNA-directed RNA polymerase subunit alpha C-terminal domain-containing protein [Brevibacillus brevis]OUQ86509.1 hypothetical protein B5G50_21490 [Brevibacillus brevis]